MNDPDYFFTVDQAPNDLAAQIMKMAEGSTAEVSGDQCVFVEKIECHSYALARKTGMIDLEIICPSGVENVEFLKNAMLTIADKRGVTEIDTHSINPKIVHLYFYPKEKEIA